MDGYGLMVAGIVPFLMPGPGDDDRARASASYGLGYTMGFAYILAVKNPMVYDPAHFINDAIAQVVGLGAAAVAFVAHPAGHRQPRGCAAASSPACAAQVALAAEAPLPGLRHRFESVNHDLFEPGRGADRAGQRRLARRCWPGRWRCTKPVAR